MTLTFCLLLVPSFLQRRESSIVPSSSRRRGSRMVRCIAEPLSRGDVCSLREAESGCAPDRAVPFLCFAKEKEPKGREAGVRSLGEAKLGAHQRRPCSQGSPRTARAEEAGSFLCLLSCRHKFAKRGSAHFAKQSYADTKGGRPPGRTPGAASRSEQDSHRDSGSEAEAEARAQAHRTILDSRLRGNDEAEGSRSEQDQPAHAVPRLRQVLS